MNYLKDSKTVLLFSIVAICLSLTTNGQISTDEKISVPQLQEDFAVIKNTLESTQLGLYLYTSKDSLGEVFDKINGSLNEPMTSLEFYRKIVPLNRSLRNLHTLFWPSASYEKGTDSRLPRFPLDIHWFNGKMYVLRNNSNQENIVLGSVVNSINGHDATTVFKTILGATIRDGFNETYPIARASRNFSACYEELIGTSKKFQVELVTPLGATQKIEIEGLTATEIKKARIEKYNGRYCQYGEDWEAWITKKEPALRLEVYSKSAIMTLRTFRTYTIEDVGQKYDEFFKNSFNQLANNKTTDLVIDLRNNHGGHDVVGMALMSYLHDSVFYYYKRRTSLVKPIGKYEKRGNIYEIVGRNDWVGKVVPATQIFRGNVYVLMNGYSVSATGEFIGHLKNIGRAVFIGEEAGGNPVVFTGGQTMHVDLPHTHVTGVIPLHLNEMNVRLTNNGHGVMPDYEVKPNITDILQGRDIEMEFVQRLIDDKKH